MEKSFIQVVNLSNRKSVYVKPDELSSTLKSLKVVLPCVPSLEDLEKYSSIRVDSFVFAKVELGKFI